MMKSDNPKDFINNMLSFLQRNTFVMLEKPISTIGIKNYPNLRDHPLHSPQLWLTGKRLDDNLDGLWRIHDKLYDFTDFVEVHPGGKDWLKLTKGTDITEAFETHHISTVPEYMLPKYFIKTINTPRNTPFTFEENGLYKTLKNNVRNELPKAPITLTNRTKMYADRLLLSFIITAYLSLLKESYILGIISGVFLAATAIVSHNFSHQKDNFRMYYLDLTTMSSRSWRISHALSHHLYTNTVYDMEISGLEPFFQYLTMPKNNVVRYASWIYTPIVYGSMYFGYFLKTLVQNIMDKQFLSFESFIPYILWSILTVITGQSLLVSIKMFLWIEIASSLIFVAVGLNAGHHHPDVFHDGDPIGNKNGIDWGLYQLSAAMDRKETRKSHFLGVITFGDHIMHHLFPSLDHGTLMFLYPVVENTMKKFGIRMRTSSAFEVTKGQFLQLSKVTVQKKDL